MSSWNTERACRPSANSHLVTSRLADARTEETLKVTTRKGYKRQPNSLEIAKLLKFRTYFQELATIDLLAIDLEAVGSWDELQQHTCDMINSQIAESDHSESMIHAAIAGTAVTGAFLEVIPRVLVRNDISNSDLREVVDASLSTMMHFARLSSDADQGITYAISSPKPAFTGDAGYNYSELRFDPTWFELEKDTVHIPTPKVAGMRDANGKRPDNLQRNDDVYFGCPFRQRIPVLYRTMAKCAFQSGLLSASYVDELEHRATTSIQAH